MCRPHHSCMSIIVPLFLSPPMVHIISPACVVGERYRYTTCLLFMKGFTVTLASRMAPNDTRLSLRDAAFLSVGAAAFASALTAWFIRSSRCRSGVKVADPTEMRDRYETSALADQYLEFHFTPTKTLFTYPKTSLKDAEDFPTRLAHLFDKHQPRTRGTVLDLGCAVGATSFELSKTFEKVIGIDLSQSFIDCANRVKNQKTVSYRAPDQGHLTIARSYTLPSNIDVSKVNFFVGDALNIESCHGTFDAILGANLLCRVNDPERLLTHLFSRLNSGGVLILVSPYSWTEEASAVSKWFGGTELMGRSEDAVKKRLTDMGMKLLGESDEPFMIRDHSRRYQLGFSHCTAWMKS